MKDNIKEDRKTQAQSETIKNMKKTSDKILKSLLSKSIENIKK